MFYKIERTLDRRSPAARLREEERRGARRRRGRVVLAQRLQVVGSDALARRRGDKREQNERAHR